MACVFEQQYLPSVQRYGNALDSAAMGSLCLSMVLGTWLASGAATQFYHPATDSLWWGMLAQLVHFDALHLTGNMVVLLLLRAAAGWLRLSRRLLSALLCCTLMVSMGLHFEYSPLAWYVGLSGALYGVSAWLLLEFIQLAPPWGGRACAYGVFLLIAVKVAFGIGTALFVMPVAHSAHLYGFMAGVIFSLLATMGRYLRLRMYA